MRTEMRPQQSFRVIDNDVCINPYDSDYAFMVLYVDHPESMNRGEGVWVNGRWGNYLCTALLEDFPIDSWKRVTDPYEVQWPLELRRDASGVFAARWWREVPVHDT